MENEFVINAEITALLRPHLTELENHVREARSLICQKEQEALQSIYNQWVQEAAMMNSVEVHQPTLMPVRPGPIPTIPQPPRRDCSQLAPPEAEDSGS